MSIELRKVGGVRGGGHGGPKLDSGHWRGGHSRDTATHATRNGQFSQSSVNDRRYLQAYTLGHQNCVPFSLHDLNWMFFVLM